ncbi:aromatic compound dioxygenase [Penicillium waksmanii]|uniref:aromatic compound dioxygenase n=1 Tax=Penicillium waksmanii TaxID=69791 RepID=UPI002548EFCF|nr:aromatic compound dioxygenase [Penicillium waksmanii]KAJ5973777.1 aromatic compound dioxygenase [Penicillium waksmanii]
MHMNFLLLASMVMTVLAHPGHHEPESHATIQRQSHLGRRCADHIATFNKRRMNKRSLTKRWEDTHNTTFDIQTEAPYYENIQNETRVLTPEVTCGPYVWPRSQTLRQDMTEDQIGIPLWLDIGVLDMNTCQPLPNALIDFWHCNATGSYSSFTGLSHNTRFEELLSSMDIYDFETGVTDLHTDDSTWLRGMWPTDAHGMMEMKTISPGFYVERAIHIHVQSVWATRSALVSFTSQRSLRGRLWCWSLMSLTPRLTEPPMARIPLTLAASRMDGYSPIISVVPADGKDVKNGMIGYLTIGVDTSAIKNLKK